MIGFDYTARIAPAALPADCMDVFRYVTTPAWAKSIGPPEYAELLASGRRTHLNDETTADFMLGGWRAGVQQAQFSRARATALGADRVPATAAWPNPRRIFYSLDIGATTAQIAVAMRFLAGAASVDGADNVGAYGEFAFVRAAMDASYAGWGTVAWSGGQRDPRAFAWQTGQQLVVGGVQVDVNDINPAAIGGSPAPSPSGGTDMALTDIVHFSPAVLQQMPEIAAEGFGGQAPLETVLGWTAARVADLLIKVDALSARPAGGPPVDLGALEAFIVQHQTAGTSAADFTAALVAHLGVTVQVVAK